MNGASGYASDGLTGPVDCRAGEQMKSLWMRAYGKNNSEEIFWIPVRGVCHFVEKFDQNLEVYASCPESSALVQLTISDQKERLRQFAKNFDLNRKAWVSRRKRSPVSLTQSLISPALQKFLMIIMTSQAPATTGVSFALAGPVLGLFFLLTSSLIPLLVQLAEENHQQVLGNGLSEISEENMNQLEENWEKWRNFDLLNTKGFQDTQHFNSMFPYSGLSNLSRQIMSTIQTFEEILESGIPISPRVANKLGRKSYTYIILDSKDHIKKVYFFARQNKQSPKQQISVFMSLNENLPLQEGVVSNGKKVSQRSTVQCVDIFRRTKSLPEKCFWKNSLGSSSQNQFLIGKDKLIFKILGENLIQINCPQTTKTIFSSGVFVFVASSNCQIHVAGNLMHKGDKLRSQGSFEIILNVPGNISNVFVPMSGRIIQQIEKVHKSWGEDKTLIVILFSFWGVFLVLWMILKIKGKKQKREGNINLRYKSPVLLPMKNMKNHRPKKNETNDFIERIPKK